MPQRLEKAAYIAATADLKGELNGDVMIIQQDGAALQSASEVIRRGGVIGYRTDTFYGLGADPVNANAVRKVIELKGREEGKPILLLISDQEVIRRFLAQTTKAFEELATRFWPGPLTLVGEALTELPKDLTAGTGTIGVRLPKADEVRNLVRVCGGALTATSANLSGRPPAVSAGEVESYFPAIDLIIDGGEVTTAEPSTVLDVTGSNVSLIREGAIKAEQLRAWLY